MVQFSIVAQYDVFMLEDKSFINKTDAEPQINLCVTYWKGGLLAGSGSSIIQQYSSKCLQSKWMYIFNTNFMNA